MKTGQHGREHGCVWQKVQDIVCARGYVFRKAKVGVGVGCLKKRWRIDGRGQAGVKALVEGDWRQHRGAGAEGGGERWSKMERKKKEEMSSLEQRW